MTTAENNPKTQAENRERILSLTDPWRYLNEYHAFVAKPVPKKQWDTVGGARAAVNKEWAKLRASDGGRGCWDEAQVRNYRDVKAEAGRKAEEIEIHIHFGTVFDICATKHSELEAAKQIPKGRVVV